MPVNKIEDVCAILQMIDGFSCHSYGDMTDVIWWRTGSEKEYAPITFFVNCNDLFYWACADCEELTIENLPRLKQAIQEVQDAFGVTGKERPPADYKDEKLMLEYRDKFDKHFESGKWGAALFCCRERKMRPQIPYYKLIPKELVDMFNACGPERTAAECG